MRLYYHRSLIAFGVGGEQVSIYEETTELSYRKLHFKIDFLFWSLHWDIRITRKTKLH